MARNTEPLVNAVLAAALDGMHPRWRVSAEQTDILGSSALRPDLLVAMGHSVPVILETEFTPAATVEDDARARLGQVVSDVGHPIEHAIAIRLNPGLRDSDDLPASVRETTVEWCVLSGDGDESSRWPARGWIEGRVSDLAHAIEQVSLSERLIAQGLEILEVGVRQAAHIHRKTDPVASRVGLEAAARLLHQEDCEQTSRMAMAIIANAMIFHKTLEGMHGIPELESARGELGRFLPSRLVQLWRRILEVNYWPIFKIAMDLLRTIRTIQAKMILDRLAQVADELSAIGATSLNDLSGRMFQRLIADRKFLATFYTLPNSSTLLAELAIPRIKADWSDASSIRKLRIGDLACGTGALLLAAYQGILARHRHTGGDDATLHPGMMERSLLAADIMPAATHLTASNLSGTHPGSTFRKTCVYTMPYGSQPQERELPVAIGSLDLLEDGRDTLALFGTGQSRAHGQRESGDNVDVRVDIPHGRLDLAIMNPPFTRPTNHESATVPVPSFAGFETGADEQREMSKRLKQIGRNMKLGAGHGNAGLASYFVDLAHLKTRPGGVIALVLPFSFAQGRSWESARRLVAAEYKDVVVVAIATTGNTDRAFSADTGMAEMLLLGTKRLKGEKADSSVLFVSLKRRPRSLIEAGDVARAVREIRRNSAQAGWMRVGGHQVGSYIRHNLTAGGAAGIANPDIATASIALAKGRLQSSRSRTAYEIPLAPLGELGDRGPIHRDLTGRAPDGKPRGPWDMHPISEIDFPPTWPALWAHEAARERRLIVQPDRYGWVREGCRDLAVDRWEASASRLHFNLDFQINSQSLAACLTPEPAIGGRAWPSFRADRDDWEIPLALWADTTPGLILFWWKGTRQHQGRAATTLSRLPQLPVLDPRALTPAQIKEARAIFAEFRERSFLPANEAYRDEVRADLDHAILRRLLDLPHDVDDWLRLLRDQWCAEPSVHGGKLTRIDTTTP